MLSYPREVGRSVIRSSEIVSKGVWTPVVTIGMRGGVGLMVFGFVLWHVAHPRTYSAIKRLSVGPQKSLSKFVVVFVIPGCPAKG